jgi:hypothetical protein
VTRAITIYRSMRVMWNAFTAMSDSEEFRTGCLCTSEHNAAGGQESQLAVGHKAPPKRAAVAGEG